MLVLKTDLILEPPHEVQLKMPNLISIIKPKKKNRNFFPICNHVSNIV